MQRDTTPARDPSEPNGWRGVSREVGGVKNRAVEKSLYHPLARQSRKFFLILLVFLRFSAVFSAPLWFIFGYICTKATCLTGWIPDFGRFSFTNRTFCGG